MPARIPISAASEVGKKHGCRQVILLAFDDEGRTHITTWGRTTDDCSQAADGGNMLKQKWGWPECNDQPSRVKKLEAKVEELRSALHVYAQKYGEQATRYDELTSSSRSASSMVREFHEIYEVPILSTPAFPDHARCRLRQDILEEEWIEFLEAIAKRDLVEVADALADMLYIIHGTALEFGIPLDAVVEEVHRSNLSKLGADGKPIRREDGKVMKGPNYFKPDIARVIGL